MANFILTQTAAQVQAAITKATKLPNISSTDEGKILLVDASGNIVAGAMPESGVASTNIAADFSSSATYAIGDLVFYEGTLYKCTTAVSTAGAWTGSTNWAATSVGVELSEKAKANNVITLDGEYNTLNFGSNRTWKSIYNSKENDYITIYSNSSGASPNNMNTMTFFFGGFSSSPSIRIQNAIYAQRATLELTTDSTNVILKSNSKSYLFPRGNTTSTVTVATTDDPAPSVTPLTTAPTAANTDGTLKFVVLSSEPATYYDGYYYIITSNS